VLTRYVDPQYDVRSTLVLTSLGNREAPRSGPIREEERLSAQAWIDLLRSFAIADSVVMQLSLYLEPERAADSTLFRGFTIDQTKQRFVPGHYVLEVEGARYTLRDKIGIVTEQGIVGDSVGRTAGFAWRPSRRALGTDREVEFTVRTPRETSEGVLQRLKVTHENTSNILRLSLTGTPQQKPAETLNAWGDQFVRLATEIKTTRVSQFSRILNQQVADAAGKLTAAERAYQQFRVATIALPNEGVSVRPGLGGVEVRSDPALDNYFTKKYDLDNVRTARTAVERLRRTGDRDRDTGRGDPQRAGVNYRSSGREAPDRRARAARAAAADAGAAPDLHPRSPEHGRAAAAAAGAAGRHPGADQRISGTAAPARRRARRTVAQASGELAARDPVAHHPAGGASPRGAERDRLYISSRGARRTRSSPRRA
jgi:hypothetical protein